jgi:hypothetical protein
VAAGPHAAKIVEAAIKRASNTKSELFLNIYSLLENFTVDMKFPFLTSIFDIVAGHLPCFTKVKPYTIMIVNSILKVQPLITPVLSNKHP